MRGKLLVAMLGLLTVFALAASQVPALHAHDGDGEQAIPQADYDRAAQAALKAVGGGRVHDVDLDSENGARYEVEVTTTDGRAVDVLLDANFKVIDVSGESDSNEPQSRSTHESHDHGDDDDDEPFDD